MNVDPTPTDDAQRTLEQHALRNVRSLAERLAHEDAMDRKRDRNIVIGIFVVVAAVVTYLGAKMVTSGMVATANEDPKIVKRRYCEMDKAYQIVQRMRLELKQADPSLTQMDLEQRVRVTHRDVKSEAARLCAGAI